MNQNEMMLFLIEALLKPRSKPWWTAIDYVRRSNRWPREIFLDLLEDVFTGGTLDGFDFPHIEGGALPNLPRGLHRDEESGREDHA